MEIYSNLEKSKHPTKDDARSFVAGQHPDLRIKGLLDAGDRWIIRLVAAKDDEMPEDLFSGGDIPDDLGDGEDKPKDKKKDKAADDSEDKPKDDSEKKDKKPKDDEGDPVAKAKGLLDELKGLLDTIAGGGIAEHKPEDHPMDELPALPGEEDIGPVPGGGPAGGRPGLDGGVPPVPRAPRPSRGFDKRKGPSVGVPAFGSRNKVVHVPFVDADGNARTARDAMNDIESLPQYVGYTITGIQSDEEEERYVARLTLEQ